MVKSNKQQRPLPATDRSSVSVNGSVNYMEHTYCVVLHVVEAINFYGREIREGEREQIIMNAALNTIDFEVEGTPSVTAETIIFNSNCIWECDMAGIKRIKTDHRPVKVTFFTCSNGERKIIGSLLLPVRGLPVLGTGGNNSALQLKMFWHKLICISNEFRSHKPEVLLMLAIIKKSLLHTKDFKHLMAFNSSEKQSRTPPLQSPGHSITANMLQSQANVYVQSLVQLGLLQVGNDPLVDCDIIEVVLQFKQLKNLNKFVKSLYTGKDVVEIVLLMFDFVGNVTNIDLKLNNTDSYTLNDVLGLRFKSSLRSIRLYFQRIFYLPINMYINGTSIANYRMDFGKLLPPDNYFADRRKYVHSGSFAFERFGRMGSARELKPIMEYTFTVEIQEVYWRQQEKEPAPQLQQQLLHEEQPDLQSVGSKAVIREVPKDRPNDHVVDWKCKSDKPSASANGSVASLNVGAELSASDERDTASESPLSDAPDSDAPVTAHTSQARRRKFTRLIVNNPDLDMEDEHEENQTYASKVVSGKLSLGRELREEEDEDFMEMADDVGSECLPTRAQEPKELRKHIPTNRNTEKQTVKAARCDMKNPNESEAPRSFKEKQLKSHLDERTSKYLRDEMQLKDHMTNSVDEYELDERNTEGSWAEQEQESETMTQHVPKGGRTHRVKSKPVKELTQAEPKVAAKPFSAETDKIDINCEDSLGSAIKINLPTEDALGIKTKIIRKKKSVTTEEIELLEAASPLKSVTTLKSAKEKKYMASQESLNEVEPEMDYASEEHKRQSRADLGKKHISKRPVDHALDIDTATETEELEELRQRSSTRKIKSKPIMPAQTEVSETLLTKKTSKTKNTVVSKTDLSLSARWVEVSKAQTKALEETEEYIGATCNAQQENTSCEEQPSESPKLSMARKQERSLRTIQKKNIEYTEVSISSEMEPSSLVEESSKESKLVRRLLKKKKLAENLEEAQKNFEMEPTSEEIFREPKVKQRVLKKKPSTAACQDEQTETQANQLRTKSNKAKEVIFLETEHATSEMESLESMDSIRKHEKKIRRVLKNASPQNCLDAEEAIKVPQDMGDKAEPRLKRRTVRTTQLEPQEADSIELDAMERRKAAKKPNKPDQSDQGEAGSKKMSATKSQMDLDALVSRLEVTVHMYDQTRGASANTTCVDQSVNTDITNMNESIKRIVAAGKQLQDEMLRTSQENLDNASQQSALDNQARKQHILSPKYETKFNELEQHVALLEQHLRKFESRTQEMQQANSKLAQEKLQLKERLVNMELQIAQLRQQNSGGNDIQQMLSEMRVQNVRYLDMTKAKDRYKKQWRRSAKRVHALKLAMYERTVQQEYLNVPSNVLNLKSILTQDAAEFEREYGRFRRSGTALSFSGSASESQEPLLKDYLRGLSTQTVQQQRPGHHVDGTRMH